METPLHVLRVMYDREPAIADPDAVLRRWSTVKPWARALVNAGANVTVFLRFRRDATLEEDGARFVFHADGLGARLKKWQVPSALHAAVRAASRAAPPGRCIVHVSGLSSAAQMGVLGRRQPRKTAIVVQHHAETPWRPLTRPLQRWGLRVADGFFFAARRLATEWVERGLISRDQQVFEVMEGSNEFRRQDRAASRSRTRLSGDPVLLWVGRLAPLKDPLTVLGGFEHIVLRVPTAKLWMAYGESDLLPRVRERIASSHTLSRSVTLLGNVPHAELEALYNSADYFVLGSHHEGSGFALAEAMACGVVPVVTDIPSFRAMTDEGRIGGCWAPGDADAFARAFLEVVQQPRAAASERTERFFHDHLSYPAIARDSIRAYESLLRSARV